MKKYTKNNIPIELIEAAELIAEDKLKKAEPILRDYLKDDPLDVNAMKLLADIGIKFRAYKDAGYLLVRALDLSPEYDQARLSYANLLYKRQLPFEALEQISILLEKDKDNIQYLTLLLAKKVFKLMMFALATIYFGVDTCVAIHHPGEN